MKFFSKTPNVPFVQSRFLLLGLSSAFVLASLFLIFTRGLNLGTDFLGGVKLQYRFPSAISEGDLRKTLEELHLGESSVIRFGGDLENRFIIKLPKASEEGFSVGTQILTKLQEKFGAEVTLEIEETVGPQVGKELRYKGILAVLVSLFCMLVYVGFRFDFQFAPGAILALFHDVLVTLGIFSFFQFEFNLTILAACLTIVGFSINDSIIVFDRIREHKRLITPTTLYEVVNQSLNETLSRTLITSFTVFLVVAILYFFGGATIQGFALALLIGVFFGSFSTFSVVAPAYIGLYELAPKLKKLTKSR